MFARNNLHSYQLQAIDYIKEQRKAALFLDMGLGKTVSTLTAMSDLLDDFTVTKVLVIAPLRVANTTWKQEAENWEHLQHIKFSICTGTAKQRAKALSDQADIYIINRECIPWLVDTTKQWDFDAIVIDESSGFKSSKSARFKALKKVTKYAKIIVLLSGTPSPQSLADLWSQTFLLDSGKRLGRTMSGFRQRFFVQTGYMGYDYKLRENAETEIKEAISDICMSMSLEDYIDMPDCINVNEYIELPPKVMKQYNEIKKEFVLSLEENKEILALSAAAVGNKLLQICNGAIYDEDKNTHLLHDEKIKALKDIVTDNPNENLIIAYNYKSDLARIREAFPKAVTMSKGGLEVEQWNKGKIKILLIHPQSAGHGLNLQKGGSVLVWFGLPWSLEAYQQTCARLYRQGQKHTVRIIHLVAKGCIDEKVIKALVSKALTQDDLLMYLKNNF